MRINHACTLLALALALPALAQNVPSPQVPPQSEGRAFDKMHERMAERLNLTDAQKASCDAIITKHRASLVAKRQAAREARRAFFEAVQKPETTSDALKTFNRAMADARLEAMLEGRAMRQELRAVLTPDQREKAARMEGVREGMRMARGGGWGERGSTRMLGWHERRTGPATVAP